MPLLAHFRLLLTPFSSDLVVTALAEEVTGHLFKRQLAFRIPISINYCCAGASVASREFQFVTSTCLRP